MGDARGLVENPRPDILRLVTFSRAIVRIPGQSFANGLTASAALGSPAIGLALAQHSAYCEALRRCGLEVTVLPPDERFPDGTFVEDTAVVAQPATTSAKAKMTSRCTMLLQVEVVFATFAGPASVAVGCRISGRRFSTSLPASAP